EKEYVHKRKQIVLHSLNTLEINCTDSVPHIALLASGGGQRAAVGLVGSLHQMEKEGLLDTLLYLGGVSGSTWSMASLYNDSQFSTNMDAAVSRLFDSPSVKLELSVKSLVFHQMDLRCLSDEANRNATNPYPIYCAIEKHLVYNALSHLLGKWFEISPHEAGFTELGLFIETSLLGSKFQNGTLLEKKKEMDMVKLQGECLQSMITGSEINTWGQPYESIDKTTKDKLEKNVLAEWSGRRRVSVVICDTEIETRMKRKVYKVVRVAVMYGLETVALTKRQEVGVTELKSSVPACLYSNERLQLIDAGLVINVPYPSFLGDKRDIDLIIAPEYSAGNMFETLTLARDYAAEMEKPFPEINDTILEDRDWPKDCYVLEGKEKEPTIIYMPLFNRRNCKGLFPNDEVYTFLVPTPLFQMSCLQIHIQDSTLFNHIWSTMYKSNTLNIHKKTHFQHLYSARLLSSNIF
uniref:PLA2c domain-containing protein n=1 Tax=Pundamilia nyererei TaxID=303518 RepID=A0A3B4H5S5_9CICH